MHQCTHCQAPLPELAQFCSHCGTPVPPEEDHSPTEPAIGTELSEASSPAQHEQSPAPNAPSHVAVSDAERPGDPSDEDMPLPHLSGTGKAADTSPSSLSTLQVSDEAPGDTELALPPIGDATSAEVPPSSLSTLQVSDEAPIDLELALPPIGNAASAEVPPSSLSTLQISDEAPGDTEVILPPIGDAASAEVPPSPLSTLQISDEAPIDTQPTLLQSASDENRPLPVSAPVRRQARLLSKRWLASALVVLLLILATGVGAFALIRQHSPATSSICSSSVQTGCTPPVTGNAHQAGARLTFAGSISGPLTLSAQVRCQATALESLRTLMVTLSGTVSGSFYNFGFVINHYRGPGTYTASLTILLALPGEATNNGWGNSSSADSGTITIARGEQTGSITSVLSGFGNKAGTQVQISGDWTCA